MSIGQHLQSERNRKLCEGVTVSEWFFYDKKKVVVGKLAFSLVYTHKTTVNLLSPKVGIAN